MPKISQPDGTNAADQQRACANGAGSANSAIDESLTRASSVALRAERSLDAPTTVTYYAKPPHLNATHLLQGAVDRIGLA